MIEKTVAQYVEVLAAREPTPGGGGAAALAGALAAALNSMVANFTVGNKKYADVEEEVKDLLAQSEQMRGELVRLVDADSEAYGEYDRARLMPKDTPHPKGEERRTPRKAEEKEEKTKKYDPVPLLKGAFDMAVQEDGWANLGTIGFYLRQLDPGFDPRTYGYKQLSQLIKSYSSLFEMRFKDETGRTNVYMKIKE